jgi:translation initiation factor IF-3
MTDREHIEALIRSNDELRAALVLAGKEFAKREMTADLRFGRMLQSMREAITDSREVVKAAKADRRTPSVPVR